MAADASSPRARTAQDDAPARSTGTSARRRTAELVRASLAVPPLAQWVREELDRSCRGLPAHAPRTTSLGVLRWRGHDSVMPGAPALDLPARARISALARAALDGESAATRDFGGVGPGEPSHAQHATAAVPARVSRFASVAVVVDTACAVRWTPDRLLPAHRGALELSKAVQVVGWFAERAPADDADAWTAQLSDALAASVASGTSALEALRRLQRGVSATDGDVLDALRAASLA